MSDWADENAMEIVSKNTALEAIPKIADALRAAYEQGVEESAKVAHTVLMTKPSYRVAEYVLDAIRALKEQTR